MDLQFCLAIFCQFATMIIKRKIAEERRVIIKKAMIFLAALAMLTGCAATVRWEKNGATNEQAAQDMADCKKQTKDERPPFRQTLLSVAELAEDTPDLQKMHDKDAREDKFNRCMEDKGYKVQGKQ